MKKNNKMVELLKQKCVYCGGTFQPVRHDVFFCNKKECTRVKEKLETLRRNKGKYWKKFSNFINLEINCSSPYCKNKFIVGFNRAILLCPQCRGTTLKALHKYSDSQLERYAQKQYEISHIRLLERVRWEKTNNSHKRLRIENKAKIDPNQGYEPFNYLQFIKHKFVYNDKNLYTKL